MKTFLEWMKIKEDVYSKFDTQKTASVAQAIASGGDNPNIDLITKSVVNDPRLKKVTPPGVKPDEEQIKTSVQNSLKNKQAELKKSKIMVNNGAKI